MEIEKLEKNNINLNNELVNEHIQKNFLETNLGKAINTAVDIGIRAIFPDFFEVGYSYREIELIVHWLPPSCYD